MHYFDGEVAKINFNSDGSGLIHIEDREQNRVQVPFADLADFVDLLRGRQAQERQDARDDERE